MKSQLNFYEILFLKILSSKNFQKDIIDDIRFMNFLEKYKIGSLTYSLNLQKKIVLSTFLKEKFQITYINNLKAQFKQLKEIASVAEIFNKKNISFIILKSPILSKKIYNNEGARRAGCDIDILIKKNDFNRIDDVLKENGYKNYDEYSSLDLNYRCFMYFKKNSTPIDIHLKALSGIMLLDLFFPLNRDLWGEYCVETVFDIKMKYFSNELLVIYLAMLFVKEESKITRFQYLVDFYFLIKNYKEKLNYSKLANYLNKSKLSLYFLFTFDLLKKYSDLTLPKEFLNEIRFNKIRKKIVYWGLVKYLKIDYKKNIRFFFYGYKIIAFSKGYLSLILKQIIHIYKVSYLYFLKDYCFKDKNFSHIRHFNFFIKRAISSKPRNKMIFFL